MKDALELTSGYVSLLTGIVIAWLVLSPKIHEGLWIKAGMIVMVFSLFATSWHTLTFTRDYHALWAAALTLRLGLLSVCVGLIGRRISRQSWDAALDFGRRM
jgi:hypothetical protein